MVPRPPFHSVIEELLYNIYLKMDRYSGFDTLAKLNSILLDADLMSAKDIKEEIRKMEEHLHERLNAIDIKGRSIQFHFFGHRHGEAHHEGDGRGREHKDDDDHNHLDDHGHGCHWGQHGFVLRGRITDLSEDLTSELSDVKYATRLDDLPEWKTHNNLEELQAWINEFISGDERSGTKYWIKCLPQFRPGGKRDAVNVFRYSFRDMGLSNIKSL